MVIPGTQQEATEHSLIDMTLTKELIETQEQNIFFQTTILSMIFLVMFENMCFMISTILLLTISPMMAVPVAEDMLSPQLLQT